MSEAADTGAGDVGVADTGVGYAGAGVVDLGVVDEGVADIGMGAAGAGVADTGAGAADMGAAGAGVVGLGAVDFHFDVLCPWAYQTSKWVREVRRQNGVAVNWRFFSLEEINRFERKKHPWERRWSYGWSLMRIGAVLRRRSMQQLDAWYERSGRALHEEGLRVHEPEVARVLLDEAGLDPATVDSALNDESTHDEVRADHDRVVAAGGFGVPTLFFGEQALFGPVLVDPPVGAAALRLWDAVTAWLEFPRLYEMQRPKSPADERVIADVFRPYLEARDWVSINRGRVIEFDHA